MRRRRCFAMLLAAALAFIVATARGMPTAMTVEAFPGEASTEAVSSSDNAFTTEAGQIPKDGSHHGGFHYGVTEGTEADQDSKRTDEPSEATGTWPSSPQLHRPVPTAIDYEQSGGTRYAYTVDYGNGEDLTTDLAASEGNMTKTQGTEQPQEKVFWKFFNDDLDTIQPAAKDQASTSGTQLQEQRDMFSKSARYINSFGLVSEPLIEARADDTDDDVPSRLSAATMSSSGSSDPLSSSEAEPEVHKNADGSRGHTDLSSSPSVTVPSVTQTWTAATYRDVVSEDAISPRTYSTKAPAEEMPELSGTGGEGKIVQMSGMAPIAEVTSEKSHERLSIGKEDLASGNMKVDTVNGDSQQTPDDSDGEHKDEPTRSASTDKRKDPSVIVSAREEQGDAVSSGRANPFPQAGQPGSASPTIKASGGDGAQGVPSGTAQGDHLMARAGDKPDSDKVSQPGLPRTEQPKASGGVSGRGAEAPKSAEVPRSVDAPAAGNSKVTQPESPRAEQPKASEAESGRGAEAPKPAEVPRSADAPATGSSKGSQPESPRAEQPKASGGESGRGAEAPKLAEVPRTSDVPIAGNSKVTQPESPRAEQPKAGGGESGRGAEPPKSAEVPRSPDAPAAGNSKVTQPESPRAEQPKAGGGESGRGAEPPKSAEVPRSPDSPAAGNSKVTQPESPRAEQPKAGGGVSGRGAEPPNKSAEPPRSSDVPMVGNNKASQPESPRSEQNKAQVPGKASGSPESPRSEQQNPPAIVMPVTNKNSEGRADSEPETPRTVVPKIPAPSSSGQDGRGEAKGGKAPETVVIVEDKKEGKEEAKKPGPTKTVETTESETHISIDENPERKPTAAVVQEGKPHDGKKDKGEETVLVVKNVTVEVVPEADVPDSKPDKIVPVMPPKETAVYPPAQTISYPNTPYQQPPVYQPYQPYQAPPYHQPVGTVVYVPQPVYQPAPHTSYIPGPPSHYQPSQHIGPTYQSTQYQQPYASYQQTPYHTVYQPPYNPVNAPAYPQAQHTAYYTAYAPRYVPQQQHVIYVPQYQVAPAYPPKQYIQNQANHRVAYAPPYAAQHNHAKMPVYQPRYPASASIQYAVPAYRNKRRYFVPMKPAYHAHQLPVVKPRYKHPAVKRPGHQTAAHGGYRRHVDDQAHTSQLHFPPVVSNPQNAAVPNHAPQPNRHPAVHPMAPSHFENHGVHKAGYAPKMTRKGPSYSESYIPAVYWRSASDEEDPAADDMENIEVSEDGVGRLDQPLHTIS